MGRRLRFTGCAAVLAALAIAGCGGGSEGSTTAPLAAPAPLSKQAFISQANQICISSTSRIEAAADDFATAKKPPSTKQVTSIAKGVVVPALEAEVQAIQALGKPAQGAGQIQRILGLTKRGIESVKRDPAALVHGPPKQLAQANRQAKAFGAGECGLSR